MKVKDIMSKSMIVVSPSTPVSEVSHVMQEYDIGFVPIQDKDEVIGVVTDRDIVIRAIAKGVDVSDEIEKYISNEHVSISSNADVDEALALMSEEQIKRLLVKDKNKIVGIVSLSDILSVKKDNNTLKYVSNIFSSFDRPKVRNEINLVEAEADQFEL